MKIKKILMSILLLLVTFSLIACGKITVKVTGSAQVKVGQTINLTPEASNSEATFSWASSNNDVATVKDGAVTGVSAGKVTITVTATVGSKTGEASIEVTVVSNNVPVISGAEDVTIKKGTTFIPIQGVTAFDEEDGDITDKIECDASKLKRNVVGEYIITYTVEDKDGNVTTVNRKITVAANDTDAPLLTGVQDKAIVIGDKDFSPLTNVSAIDTIEDDVTSSIQVEGQVDIWKLGEYEIKYTASDSSGNKAQATRIITVGLGEFQFEEPTAKEFIKEDNKYQFAVELDSINIRLADYALARLEFKVNAVAACELVPHITNGDCQEKIALVAGENTVVVYFRVNSAILEGTVRLEAPADADLTFSDVKFAFGEAIDVTPPEIKVPEGKIVLPAEITDLDLIKGFILNGVTVRDNVDVIGTSKLDADLSVINLGAFETKEIVIFVSDTSGNRGEATRTVEFAKAYSTNLIADPTFDTDYDPKVWRLHGGVGNPVLYVEDGALIHHNTGSQRLSYDSESCPIIDTDITVLEPYHWYMLKFDVKAAVARQMSVRIGLNAKGPVWIEDFPGASNYMLNVSTKWETKYVVFYVNSAVSADGYTTISCELKNGGNFTNNAAQEFQNTFYFDNLQFYELSNENAAPKLTIDKDLPTTFGKGQDKPDLTQYVKAYDREDDENIVITADNITESLDMSKVGTYDVVYTVTDSEGETSTITLKIRIIDHADTTPPTITLSKTAQLEYDQFSTAPDITKFVSAIDDYDGVIEITMDNITTNANINRAGTYDIEYVVRDSSGNEAKLIVQITINDKEAPKVVGKNLNTYVGTPLTMEDVIANLTVTDNVDGVMTLTEANIADLDMVDFNEPGEYGVTVTVADEAGNETGFVLNIAVREKGAAKPIAGKLAVDLAPASIEKAEGCTITALNGEYTVAIANIGDYASSNKVKYTDLELDEGKTYMIKIVSKSDRERQLQFNIGLGLDASPWMDNFTIAEGSNKMVKIGTEYAEYRVIFTYDKQSTGEDYGPTLEFCLGKTGNTGDVSNNNVYFKEFAIYEVREAYDINLLTTRIDPQKHELGNAVVISKAKDADQNGWIGIELRSGTDLTGYTKVVGIVMGTAGEELQLKPFNSDDAAQTFTMTGELQPIEIEFTVTYESGKVMVILPNVGKAGTNHKFLIGKLELQGEGKDSIDLLSGKLSKAEKCSYKKIISLAKPTTVSEIYDCAKFQVSDDLSGYAAIKYTLLGKAGETVTIKTNNNNDYAISLTMTGELQTGIIDISKMKYDASTSAMIVFVNINRTGTGNPVYLYELSYLVDKPTNDGSELEETDVFVQSPKILANAESGNYATFSEDKTTATLAGLGKSITGSQWGRWDIVPINKRGFTDIVAVLRVTPGLKVMAKIDASSTPGNNAYDGIKGNKQTLVAGEDGILVFRWNLEEFAAAAKSAGKAFSISNITKLVFFACDGTGNETAMSSATIELVSLHYAKVLSVSEAIDQTEELTGNVSGTYSEEKYYVTGEVKKVDYYELKDASNTVIGHYATIELMEDDKVIKASCVLDSNQFGTIEEGNFVVVYGFLKYDDSASISPKDNTNYQTGDWPMLVSIRQEAIVIGDMTKPVITVSQAVQNALENTTFEAGQDVSEMFSQLMAGITATDDVDGDIAITNDMVDLGGLNLTSLVAGNYKITITVSDKAGNVATLEISIHVEGEIQPTGDKANVNLLSDLPNTATGYHSNNWSYDIYNGDSWQVVTSEQMRARLVSDTLWTTNMYTSTGALMRYKYATGVSLGLANTLTFKYANNFSGGSYELKYRVHIIDIEGNQITILGSEDNWISISANTGITPITLNFDDVEVMQVVFELHGTSSANQYLYVGDLYLTYSETQATDKTAPVITISDAVQQALTTTTFKEGQDVSEMFSQLMAGITATDDVDGDITITNDMVDLGGLNPTSLVAGDYKITITVSDAAGNVAKKELAIRVVGKLQATGQKANVDLLADLPHEKTGYHSNNWSYDQYSSDGWQAVTSEQMRARLVSNTLWTTNMYTNDVSLMRYKYATGVSLGLANTLTFKYANNFDSGSYELKYRVSIVDIEGNVIYILGSSAMTGGVSIQANTGITPITLEFDEVEVASVIFELLGTSTNNQYLYVGDLYLTYEEN